MKKQFENVDDRECELWGNCSCFWTLELWGRLLQDENKTWFMDELEWGETTLFISLACIAKHCPNQESKAYAQRQLEDKYWAKQKAMSPKGWA